MPLRINAMNMEIKVVIKKRAPKPKTPRGITRAAFAMALLFFCALPVAEQGILRRKSFFWGSGCYDGFR